jgi:riboflavin synthase
MFTGIIEMQGKVLATEPQKAGLRFRIESAVPMGGRVGDSIAINGCCLTVVNDPAQNRVLEFDVSPETLAKTNLGALKAGSKVNLERAMALGDRLGGHLVSGHVDGVALLKSRKNLGDYEEWEVLVPREFSHLLIPKGSICLDGVSLTVNALTDTAEGCLVNLCLIPTTLNITTFAGLTVNWKLNVELDMMGKYIARFKDLAAYQ